MAGILKKALSLFVEVDDNTSKPSTPSRVPVSGNNSYTHSTQPSNTSYNSSAEIGHEDMDKFEKHFEKLLSDNNIEGPDYYEFEKMMDTLETHVPDENTRMQAVFATLAIQGLTKEKLVSTAGMYQKLIENDKAQFEAALNDKTNEDITQKEQSIKDLEASIQQNAETIQQLTKQIADAHAQIEATQQDLQQQKSKLDSSKNSYYFASDAMLKKISTDIQKILNNIQ